jgi:hypothetical protein
MILYEGPSALDGSPIVVIATGYDRPSKNAKTGAMIQTWIIRADVSPLDAVASGADSAICGACPHRRASGGACYVNVSQAPLSVWKTYKRGGYAHASPDDIARLSLLKVRAGAYGDPSAVPGDLWERLQPWTGYTHQWHTPNGARLRGLIMASVDSEEEARSAAAAGWRYFRVRPEGAPAPRSEVDCPSVTKALSCHDCGLCKGLAIGAKSVSIEVHGTKKSAFKRLSVLA